MSLSAKNEFFNYHDMIMIPITAEDRMKKINERNYKFVEAKTGTIKKHS